MADDPILFKPENRLLGSSTGDLSLYGGQSDDGFVVREARSGDARVDAAPAGTGGGAPSSSDASTVAPSLVPGDAVPSDTALSGAGAPVSFLISSPATAFQAPAPLTVQQSDVAAPFTPAGPTGFSSDAVPQPSGSGSTAPQPPIGSDPPAAPITGAPDGAAQLTGNMASSVVAPTLDGTQTLIDGLVQAPAAIVGDVLGAAPVLVDAVAEAAPTLVDQAVVPALGAATDLVEGVAQVPAAVTVAAVTPALDGAAALVDTVGQAPGAVTDAIVDPALDTVTAVADTLAPAAVADTVVAPVIDLVGDVAGGVVQAVDAVAGDVIAPAVSATAEPLEALAGAPSAVAQGVTSPIADTTGDVVSATVGAVSDTLDGLAGSDPEGGVATLVSLVSVTDMFDLHPAEAPVPEPASDPGFGTLDLLATDDSDSGLLGGQHDDTSGSESGSDHHPFGL